MKKPFGRLILAMLILLAAAVPGYSQAGAISGTVLDRDGKPLVNATVVIERKEYGQRSEVKTNNKGFYLYRGDFGLYRVTVIQNGTPVAGADDIRINYQDTLTQNFDLRAQAQQKPGTGPVSPPLDKAQKEAENRAIAETQGAFSAGLTALTAGDNDEAIKQFLLAAERRPNMSAIYMRLGSAYLAAKKFNDAADTYKKAVQLTPDAAAFNSYGNASIQAGRVDEGINAVQKAVELDPARGATAYLTLGMILAERQFNKEAREAFQKSITNNPNGADAYYQRGLLELQDPKTTADAIPLFEKYLKLAPKGENATAARQLIEAAKATTPSR
jgi:tetratricopeptide (TPR) repeat protein